MNITKREFLTHLLGTSALVSSRKLLAVSPAMFLSSPAGAAGMAIAAIAAAVALAGQLGLFGDKSGGSTQRWQVIDLKLSQILNNQETILKSIQLVNQSVEKLGRDIDGKFRNNRFDDAHEEAEKIYNKIKKRVAEVSEDEQRLVSEEYYRDSFVDLRNELEDAITGLRSKIKEIPFSVDGTALAVKAVRTAYLVAEAQRMFAHLEFKFSEDIERERWVPHVAFDEDLKMFEECIEILESKRIPEAHYEQNNLVAEQLAFMAGTLWGPVTKFVLAQPANNSVPEKGSDVEFDQKASFVVYSENTADVEQSCAPNFGQNVIDTLDGDSRNFGSSRNSSTYLTVRFNSGYTKVGFKVATANLNGETENADTIVGFERTEGADKFLGNRVIVRNTECLSGTESYSVNEANPATAQGVPEAQQTNISKSNVPILDRLDSDLPMWLISAEKHGLAQSYKLVLSELSTIIENIKSHNDKMRSIAIPALKNGK